MTDLSQYLGGAFDPSQVEPSEYELVNPGNYAVTITGTEIKQTSTGGTMLVINFQIAGSQYDGKVLKERLNIANPNAKAVKIALQTLARICDACGIAMLKNSDELLGKRMMIEVIQETPKNKDGTIKKYIDKYGVEQDSQPQNKIKSYRAMNGVVQQPPVQAQVAAPVQQAAAPAAVARPWAKK